MRRTIIIRHLGRKFVIASGVQTREEAEDIAGEWRAMGEKSARAYGEEQVEWGSYESDGEDLQDGPFIIVGKLDYNPGGSTPTQKETLWPLNTGHK